MKPCPFCGNKFCKVSVANKTVYKTTRWVVSVLCPSCHTRGPRQVYHEEREKESAIDRAIWMWNEGVER